MPASISITFNARKITVSTSRRGVVLDRSRPGAVWRASLVRTALNAGRDPLSALAFAKAAKRLAGIYE